MRAPQTPDRPDDAARVEPDCFACRHLWITHDAAWPYGCRAFAIKSARVPSVDVRESSGAECRAFAPKPTRR